MTIQEVLLKMTPYDCTKLNQTVKCGYIKDRYVLVKMSDGALYSYDFSHDSMITFPQHRFIFTDWSLSSNDWQVKEVTFKNE